MDKMGYPRGLIKYTTQNRLDGQHTSFVRPRILVYATILIGIIVGTLIGIINRAPIELDIIRDRNSLYRETGIGTVENVYTLKVINKDMVDHEYRLSAEGFDGLKLNIQRDRIFAESGAVIEVPVSLEVDPDILPQRSNEVFFKLEAIDADLSIVEEARFLGPIPLR